MNRNLILGRIFNALGYEVRRRGSGFHLDAFDDQRTILSARTRVTMIFDVGANIGQTSHRYKTLFPSAVIHAFEPFKSAFDTLSRQFNDDSHVRPHMLAIADSPGPKLFFVNKASVTNSLLPTAEGSFDYVPSSMTGTIAQHLVETTTLDEFCNESHISKINILKMDIQGAELMALRGAKRLLSAASVDLIFLEVSFAPLYEGQADFHQVVALLGAYQYALYGLYNPFVGSNSLLAQADAIFVSPGLRGSLRKGAKLGDGI